MTSTATLKIRNKDSKILASKQLSIDLEVDIISSYINFKDKNTFLLCLIEYGLASGKVKCTVVNFDNNKIINKITLGDYLTVFNSCPALLHKVNINIINNNKIAIGCSTHESAFISIIEYSSNKLTPGSYFDKKIITKSGGIIFNPYLNYYENKGYILYYLYGKESDDNSGLYKLSFNPTCSNFIITLSYVSEKQTFSFNDYINSGLGGNKINFKITNINKNVNLYYNKKKIKAGNTEYSQDSIFEIEAKYSTEEIKILYTISTQTCSTKIRFKSYNIKIDKKTEQCIKTKKGVINNIISHDLVTEFSKDDEKIEFLIEFQNEVTNNELTYFYKGKKFKCKKYKNTYALCQSPIPKKEIKEIKVKNEYRIESKFVCENTIFIDTLKISDPYIWEIYDAKNHKKLTQTLNKNYNPASVIKEFDLDMITYYCWFGCYSHCTIEQILKKECCKNYFKEWKIFDYKAYNSTYFQYLKDCIKVNYNIDERLKKEFLKMNIETKSYIVFKNDKYKKYVLLFGVYGDPIAYTISLLISPKTIFEISDKDVLVNDFIRDIFKSIEDDVFSEKLIDDMNKNKDYQIIFTGHSFGGAVATLSIYSFVKNYIEDRNPILITFGQPRVGNEEFANKFNKLVRNVYRIAKTDDFLTMIPPIKEQLGEWYEKIFNNDFVALFCTFLAAFDLVTDYVSMAGVFKKLFKKLIGDFLTNLRNAVLEYLAKQLFSDFIGYCHIGGLYILNKERNSFFHCVDFGNKDTNHYICKNYNWNVFSGTFHNHDYFFMDQNIRERCLKEINLK